jgi:protein-L-isoaspartate(D-aspartate) O-methyltransferase
MSERRSARLRRGLVAELEAAGQITTPSVRRAFLEVPRELFVPEFAASEGLEAVYRDEAIITRQDEHGAPTSSSSQPAIMALMLERLDLSEGQRVLEVGAGTGYNAALLSQIVGPRGRVVSIELDRERSRRARRALAEAGSKVRVVCRDGRSGFAEAAPYDRIIVTASTHELPQAWWQQLAPTGLLEAPLRLTADGAQAIPTLRKEGRTLRSISVLCGGFMPLRGTDGRLPDESPRLLVSEVREGASRPLLWLSGAALARLSERARRRLVVLALSDPRVRRVRAPAAKRWSLALYLSLEAPRTRAVASYARDAVAFGLFERNGRSLALFGGPFKGSSQLNGYGEREAEERLMELIDRWRKVGEPTEDALEIQVRFEAERQLRWSWRTAPRPRGR